MIFDRVNIADLVVACTLGGALVMAVMCSMQELAMSIASGLLGYLGGAKLTSSRK